MNASYDNTLDFHFFSPALDHFNAMIRHLESACLQDHGVTEEYIRTNGDELLRRMYQGYLDFDALNTLAAAGYIMTDKKWLLVGKVASRLSSNEIAAQRRAEFRVIETGE